MPGLHNLFNTLTSHLHLGRGGAARDAALYKAAKEGSIKKVRQLLKDGANPNTLHEHHLSPLHQAAYWGEIEITELLLQHGADAGIDNGQGWTPLHSAAVAGGLKTRQDVIDLLIEKGADAAKKDKHGWTASDYMVLWEANEAAALKLKQHMDQHPQSSKTPAAKTPSLHTPKH